MCDKDNAGRCGDAYGFWWLLRHLYEGPRACEDAYSFLEQESKKFDPEKGDNIQISARENSVNVIVLNGITQKSFVRVINSGEVYYDGCQLTGERIKELRNSGQAADFGNTVADAGGGFKV